MNVIKKASKSRKINDAYGKYVNCLSRDLLKKLGNLKPTQKQLQLMSHTLSTVAVTQNLSFDKRLTDREICCLYWAAMGKTSIQTAELLNLQRYTVEEYRKEIKRKLDCKSMAEAVFKGMRFGYVQVEKK